MLTDVQFEQLQRLSRKPRNAKVAEIVKDLFLNHGIDEQDGVIDAMDEPFDFKRYVRTGRDTLLSSYNGIIALNQFLSSGQPGTQKHFELILALYQYQPNNNTQKQLELRIVHQVPASRVAEITDTTVQHLSRSVSQYNKKQKMIEEVRAHF
ncbi:MULTISPECIES: hypothetical protein [Vibrio]|uniref:hypothetical protein n=1 Tax=Vibrio TaxID=662 RepID=UPI00207645E2|nr:MULTISPECIES: hypothetical protein [Vibrio]USD35620.1 hypothetical protein J8Z27_22695 [Vibrio sp. SCSIO 43186]USD72744.1 hypothetical protein J4N41_22700 [Vibrio sp. SCSIO 43139]USD98949.1 hypothetical protein CTT30_23025 [Vibrio coralliilyticus]